MSELALPDDPQFSTADLVALKSVPKEYRTDVSRIWAFNAHLLPSPLVLCVRTKYWIAEYGLTSNEFTEIVSRLMSPERSAKHRFPADLVTDLSVEVGIAAQRRKSQREAEERRRADTPVGEAERKEIQRLLAELRNRTQSDEIHT